MWHIGASGRGHCNLSEKAAGENIYWWEETVGVTWPGNLLPCLRRWRGQCRSKLPHSITFANIKTTHTRKVTCHSKGKSTLFNNKRVYSYLNPLGHSPGWSDSAINSNTQVHVLSALSLNDDQSVPVHFLKYTFSIDNIGNPMLSTTVKNLHEVESSITNWHQLALGVNRDSSSVLPCA